MKRQWLHILCAVLLVINLVLTGLIIGGILPKAGEEKALNTRYTLYIGTTDKDTNSQLISTQDALAIVNEICARHVTGYTATTGFGGWVNEAGELIQEESLIYTFIDAEEEQILHIKDEVLQALNQSAILYEYQEVASTFFED